MKILASSLLVWLANSASASNSTLPNLFSCQQPITHDCVESYYSFEPAMAPMCGAGLAVRNVLCPKGPDFLGACRTAIQGGGGYLVQVVIFYYQGHPAGTREQVAQICAGVNGEYLAN